MLSFTQNFLSALAALQSNRSWLTAWRGIESCLDHIFFCRDYYFSILLLFIFFSFINF